MGCHCKRTKTYGCRKPEPWRNFTVTRGFCYIFNSGAKLNLQKDQFALIAARHRCVKGKTLRECDGFKLMQLDTGNGNIMQPIDVERLLNGENPVDPFYSGFSPEQRALIDAKVKEQTGQSMYVITSLAYHPTILKTLTVNYSVQSIITGDIESLLAEVVM